MSDEMEYIEVFCQHYSDPNWCEEVCTCGHPCYQHSYYSDEHECGVTGCNCEKFNDKGE